MATRSTIAIEFADHSISQVYCHFDGYLGNNGEILHDNYTDPFKVRDLINLGDFSSLKDTVEETKLNSYHPNASGVEPRHYTDMVEYETEGLQEEYDYILRNIGGTATWFVRFYATGQEWITLTEAFDKESKYSQD
jgi:hypothetical protein